MSVYNVSLYIDGTVRRVIRDDNPPARLRPPRRFTATVFPRRSQTVDLDAPPPPNFLWRQGGYAFDIEAISEDEAVEYARNQLKTLTGE